MICSITFPHLCFAGPKSGNRRAQKNRGTPCWTTRKVLSEPVTHTCPRNQGASSAHGAVDVADRICPVSLQLPAPEKQTPSRRSTDIFALKLFDWTASSHRWQRSRPNAYRLSTTGLVLVSFYSQHIYVSSHLSFILRYETQVAIANVKNRMVSYVNVR